MSADQVDPVPARLPYLALRLPPSIREYYAYESGLQHTMLQVRFELDPADLAVLERSLPCRLGPARTGEPEYALVGTNDRTWYEAARVRKHRGCEYRAELKSGDFLVDLDHADRVVVYAVISNE